MPPSTHEHMSNFDLNAIKDIASIVKDVIVAIAAIATSTVAIYGINSWRRETVGKAQHEAAKAVLAAAYKLRNEIRSARSAVIWAAEFPPDGSVGTPGSLSHVYATRWAPVKAAAEGLELALLEGEAVFGNTLRAAADVLLACARKLWAAMETYLDLIRAAGHEDPRDDTERSFRRLLHRQPEDDDFEAELVSAVCGLEVVLAPYLRRNASERTASGGKAGGA